MDKSKNDELINELPLNLKKKTSEVMNPDEFSNCTTQISEWKNSYTESLKNKNYQDHIKRGKIALRVLEPYMKSNKFLTFDELLDGIIMTKVLNCFKE